MRRQHIIIQHHITVFYLIPISAFLEQNLRVQHSNTLKKAQIVFVPIFWFSIYLFVKRVEGLEAIKKFGKAYVEYSKKVPAFIPRRNCFKKY